MDGFTDIQARGWVRHLPARLIPYALLARFDRPIGSWLLFLPGLWAIIIAAGGWRRGLWLVLLFAVGAVTMRGAGCVVNDLWDREMDAAVARTAGRPLASGMLRPRDALVFLLLLLLVGLAVLSRLNNATRLLGVLILLPVVLYPLAKRVTWWPQIVLGLVFGWGAIMGYAAGAGRLGGAGLLLYAAAILWILGYDTIYAHQDREDDALIGVKSTARLFGARTRPFLLACYGGMLICLAAAMVAAHLHLAGIFALLLPAALLAWQVIRLNIDDPALCLALFKSNRNVGLAVAAALLIGRF